MEKKKIVSLFRRRENKEKRSVKMEIKSLTKM
jgi:hypothetical protein